MKILDKITELSNERMMLYSVYHDCHLIAMRQRQHDIAIALDALWAKRRRELHKNRQAFTQKRSKYHNGS